jgi:hypothetical protein
MSNPAASSSTQHHCACVPCEVPAFCRVSYYTGKLLTARDFADEQRYHSDKLRLHNMALHGWGSVCGLKVKPHPHCPDLRIIVEAGLAIDDCGREVRLLKDVELELPKAPDVLPPPQPCPPDPTSQQAEHALRPEPEHHKHESLWVCLRYCERPEQFAPAPFDECGCSGPTHRPNSVCESYCLELLDREPHFLKEIEKHKECGEDCMEVLYNGLLDPCEPGHCHCIPLAVIGHYTPGERVTERMIDNWRHRPFLPSVHRLDKVVRCILEKLPHGRLTHISQFNWAHGGDLYCHDFLRTYIGHDRGFDITFDAPVRHEGLTPRTYQALIVHLPGDPDQPRRMEIAPAHVEVLSPTLVRLRIHEHYARRHLDGHNFDLFLTLKCNVVVDHHGRPVDGDLLARLEHDGHVYSVSWPTGDGVPGGLFESWIRVRSGEGRREQH